MTTEPRKLKASVDERIEYWSGRMALQTSVLLALAARLDPAARENLIRQLQATISTARPNISETMADGMVDEMRAILALDKQSPPSA